MSLEESFKLLESQIDQTPDEKSVREFENLFGKEILEARGRVRELYLTSRDSGTHSASEWLLKQWREDDWLESVEESYSQSPTKDSLSTIKDGLQRNISGFSSSWFRDAAGNTMVVVPNVVGTDGETIRNQSECEFFAIATKLVTVEELRRWQFEDDSIVENGAYVALQGLPALFTSWRQVAEYCNWLSRQEGLAEGQWCYEISENEVKVKKNYLSLEGYRLPTEAELESASRGGAKTNWFFGDAPELLPEYAWLKENSQGHAWPVGMLKPNSFGLFDVHGNTPVWCHTLGHQSAELTESDASRTSNNEQPEVLLNDKDRIVIRGSSFTDDAEGSGFESRSAVWPTSRLHPRGIRVARTVLVGP